MKTLAALLSAVLLASCASAPPMPPAAPLLHDELFGTPSAPIDPGAALAVSPAMQRYLSARLVSRLQLGDRRRDRKSVV